MSQLTKHRTLWPNLMLITIQKALYKVQLVLRGRKREGEGGIGRLMEEGEKTSHLDRRQETKTADRPGRSMGRKSLGGLKRRRPKRCRGAGGLISSSHQSRRGNVMETLEFLQTLSTMATVWQHAPSLAPCRFREYQQGHVAVLPYFISTHRRPQPSAAYN